MKYLKFAETKFIAHDSLFNSFVDHAQSLSAMGDKITKEDYLTWRKEWAGSYKVLANEIKHAKKNRKQDHIDNTFTQTEWISRARRGRIMAQEMMQLLNDAKAFSQEIVANSKTPVMA